MFKKLFSLFAALTLSVGLWAEDVITYTATTSLQELFNNQEKFEPAPMSNDYAEGIGTVTFPNLTEIRNEAFKDCSALTSITLPASIQRIGDEAFANCEYLESITCKASQPPMCSPSAFENITLPMPLYVPALSIEAYQEGFWGDFFEVLPLPIAVGDQFKDETTGLYFEITSLGTPKTVKVIQDKFMNYSNSSYNIPSSVTYSNATYTVTEIGDDAFYNCGDVTSITLPSTITTIGADAFCICSFSSIDLPAALTAIGSYAFWSCKNLQSIIVPASVTTIDYNAFDECTALQEVTFLGNACQNGIGDNVFNKVGATTPATLTLPDSWTGSTPDAGGNWYGGKFAVPGPEVGDQFEDATSGLKFEVTSLEPKTVKVIANNYSNTSYTVPDSVTYMNEKFAITEIGESAFDNCNQLKSINMPYVTTIGKDAFAYCEALESATMPNATTIKKSAFDDCIQLQSATMPNVTTIEERAFSECVNMGSVTMPKITAIGTSAFYACNMLSLTLPATLTTIGNLAFEGCINLESITCEGTTPPTCGTNCFNYVDNIPVYVPAGAGMNYFTADEWKNLTIIEAYTREGLSYGKIGTVCLSYAVPEFVLNGVVATFYAIDYYNESESALYVSRVDALEAGKPYIYEAKANAFTLGMLITENPAAASNANGLYGTLEDMTLDAPAYAIVNNEVVKAAVGSTVAANRAYIKLDEVSPKASGAPTRKLGVARGTTTEDIQLKAADALNGKFIINGQFVIVKDGKKINALGF